MASCGMLTLEDINEFIKHFALQIQDRIEELHKKRGIFFTYNDHTLPDEINPIVTRILKKYAEYSSSESLEVKIIKKFTERILQIFTFFKQNYISPSENLFAVIENKIKKKLDSFISMNPIPIGEILQFTHFLTTKNSLTSILKNGFKKQQKDSKKKRSYLNSCSSSIKINLHSQPDEEALATEVIERKRENQTELSKILVTKNQFNFERLKDRHMLPQFEPSIDPEKRPFTSKENQVRYRRSGSTSKELPNWRKHSITNRKEDGYLKIVYKDKENFNPTEENVKKPVEITKLYVTMNLDRRNIEKLLERKELLFKDMLKRNEKIFNQMKKEHKKEKLESETNQSKDKDEKHTMKKQSHEREECYLKLLTDHNINIVNAGINKKQSFRNMIYQSHLEKKKKCLDKQSGTHKRSISKHEPTNIQDKENVFGGM